MKTQKGARFISQFKQSMNDTFLSISENIRHGIERAVKVNSEVIRIKRATA